MNEINKLYSTVLELKQPFLLKDLLDVNPTKTTAGSFLQEISCSACAILTGIEDSDL